MNVLLVSGQEQDGPNLESILEGTPWRVMAAGNLAQAEQILRDLDPPIVLCDRDLLGSSWQENVRSLAAARRGACVILLSNVSDQYLWDEVVQRGGFDVLTRPFEKQPVLSMLIFAYTHCRTSWPIAPRGRVGVKL